MPTTSVAQIQEGGERELSALTQRKRTRQATVGAIAELPFPEPGLVDEIVRLRPWSHNDVDDAHEATQDALIARFTRVPENQTKEDISRFIEGREPARQSGNLLPLVIADARSDDLLGTISLMALEWEQRRGGIGFWLVPWARGQGRGHACRPAAFSLGAHGAWSISGPTWHLYRQLRFSARGRTLRIRPGGSVALLHRSQGLPPRPCDVLAAARRPCVAQRSGASRRVAPRSRRITLEGLLHMLGRLHPGRARRPRSWKHVRRGGQRDQGGTGGLPREPPGAWHGPPDATSLRRDSCHVIGTGAAVLRVTRFWRMRDPRHGCRIAPRGLGGVLNAAEAHGSAGGWRRNDSERYLCGAASGGDTGAGAARFGGVDGPSGSRTPPPALGRGLGRAPRTARHGSRRQRWPSPLRSISLNP